MVAIIANLARIYEKIFVRNLSSSTEIKLYSNPEIPPPLVLHKYLDDEFLSRFDDILIVGDLHGCYDEFLEILNIANKISKQNSRILKLFVGDLINKGPKSKQIIEHFMNNGKEDMLAVRGNHEERAISEYLKYLKDKDYKFYNSEYNWVKELNTDHIDFLISLPYTISLPKLNSIIVHAGLVPGKPLGRHNWLEMTKMRNIIYGDYFEGDGVKGIESDQIGDEWIKGYRGDLHIYFGHDAKRGLQLTEYATGLDTGVVYGKKLTAVLIDQSNLKKQFLEVKAKKVYCDPIARREIKKN